MGYYFLVSFFANWQRDAGFFVHIKAVWQGKKEVMCIGAK
jgi:hypothetical protein